MKTFLLLLPAGLGLVTLAAHFLRRGNFLVVLACLAALTLLGVRRRSAARALQIALVIGAAEWLRTLAVLLPERRAAGEPGGRLALILGAVALVSLLGAALFETPALRRRFAPPSPAGPTPGAAPDA